MTKQNTHTIQGNSSFQNRLTAYSTLAVAGACAVAAAPKADAAVVYSGSLNYSVPATVSGVYVDLANFHLYPTLTAATAVEGATAPILNIWGTSNTYTYLYPSASTINRFVAADGTNPSELAAGVTIGAASTYSASRAPGALTLAPGAWTPGSTGYLGIRFLNGATTEYAWVQISAQAPPTAANPTKLLGIAFENTGASIIAGAVPEPGTVGCLAAGVLGVGSLAWRRRKAA